MTGPLELTSLAMRDARAGLTRMDPSMASVELVRTVSQPVPGLAGSNSGP